MMTLGPPNGGWTDKQAQNVADVVSEIPIDETVSFDDISDFDYLKNTGISHLGMPYFDFDGNLQYDNGIYERPEQIDSLNPKLYWTIIKNVNAQKAKYQFKLQNGRSPTKEELFEAIKSTKPKNQSDSLMNYISDQN
jgi:hypothetical protein